MCVSYFNCCECNKIASDSGDNAYCCSCNERFCSQCMYDFRKKYNVSNKPKDYCCYAECYHEEIGDTFEECCKKYGCHICTECILYVCTESDTKSDTESDNES
jgi:hypothetical protein